MKMLISFLCFSLLVFGFKYWNNHKNNSKNPPLNQKESPMETHCFGRFLMDLPSDTKIIENYISLGAKVKTFSSITLKEFQNKVSNRQKVLQNSMHNNGDSLFVDRDDISSHHITLTSWSSKTGKRIYRYDEYQYLPESQTMFYFTSEGTATPENRAKAAENQRKFSQLNHYRPSSEIPQKPGLCICEGFIEYNKMNKEVMSVGFSFPNRPTVRMWIETFTTRYDTDVPPLPRSFGNILRKKRYKWNGKEATEFLYKFKDDGQWFYEFTLKVSSSGESLIHPYMTISLQAGDFNYENQERIKPFSNDKEALEFWDSIVKNVRIRPGAVIDSQ